jgi:HNH endonuclease
VSAKLPVFTMVATLRAHPLNNTLFCSLSRLAGIEDIDDPRNGLLLFKPVEWGFDTSRLYFKQDEAGKFCLHVLDPALRTKSMLAVLQELQQVGPKALQLDTELFPPVSLTSLF